LKKQRTRINEQIRASELRVIDSEDGNLGVLSTKDALEQAQAKGLDLVEISPEAKPPVAKIVDYGKFQYEQKKKLKLAKSKAHSVETKVVQIKLGTGDHDLALKAKRVSDWLSKGNRIKIDLFLPGRSKYMDVSFLNGRLERFLTFVTEEYKIAQEIRKSPKGRTLVVEKISK
jgi:translation initiation factor IF-3